MTELDKWRLRAMASICHGYLDSYYKSLCLACGESIRYNLTIKELANEVSKMYLSLELDTFKG